MPSGTASSSRKGPRRTEFTAPTESAVLLDRCGVCYTSAMITAASLPERGQTHGDTFIASITDISNRLDRAAGAAATEAQISFQRPVADVAARLSAVAPDAVDRAISDCLRARGDALRLDSVMLCRRGAGEARPAPTHAWAADGDTAAVEAVNDLPEGRESYRQCGHRCDVVVPLPADGDGARAALAFGSIA